MAPYSSTLVWKIPWMEEPCGLQSMGSLRVGHDQATSLSLFTFMHWRRKWQTTPVFLPRESQGWGNLVGYRLWGHTESDTTEVTQHSIAQSIRMIKHILQLQCPKRITDFLEIVPPFSCGSSDKISAHNSKTQTRSMTYMAFHYFH